MIKKLICLFILLGLVSGCSNAVKSSLADRYPAKSPETIAVMPVVWENGEHKEISATFRTMSIEKLKELNYRVVSADAADEAYRGVASKPPSEAARLLNADAVLYIRIKEWNVDRFVTYASLKVDADYELYSATGERLWNAGYAVKDADLRLDTPSMEYAIIKAYEPKVQRFVDAVFSTLPRAQARSNTRTFFQWLP